jgi:hypothetical protein
LEASPSNRIILASWAFLSALRSVKQTETTAK